MSDHGRQTTSSSNLRSISGSSFAAQPDGAGLGLVMLLLVLVYGAVCAAASPLRPEEPVRVTIDDIYARPSAAHWLGTDDAGQDVLSNFIYGARVSLIVGFFASFISIVIGGVIGIVGRVLWAGAPKTC